MVLSKQLSFIIYDCLLNYQYSMLQCSSFQSAFALLCHCDFHQQHEPLTMRILMMIRTYSAEQFYQALCTAVAERCLYRPYCLLLDVW